MICSISFCWFIVTLLYWCMSLYMVYLCIVMVILLEKMTLKLGLFIRACNFLDWDVFVIQIIYDEKQYCIIKYHCSMLIITWQTFKLIWNYIENLRKWNVNELNLSKVFWKCEFEKWMFKACIVTIKHKRAIVISYCAFVMTIFLQENLLGSSYLTIEKINTNVLSNDFKIILCC
jgi:hypothetical protein